jgi:hypothetical protein
MPTPCPLGRKDPATPRRATTEALTAKDKLLSAGQHQVQPPLAACAQTAWQGTSPCTGVPRTSARRTALQSVSRAAAGYLGAPACTTSTLRWCTATCLPRPEQPKPPPLLSQPSLHQEHHQLSPLATCARRVRKSLVVGQTCCAHQRRRGPLSADLPPVVKHALCCAEARAVGHGPQDEALPQLQQRHNKRQRPAAAPANSYSELAYFRTLHWQRGSHGQEHTSIQSQQACARACCQACA